jgi:hypothetical protein
MSFIIPDIITLEDYFVEFVGHKKLMFPKLKFKQFNSMMNVNTRVLEVMTCGMLWRCWIKWGVDTPHSLFKQKHFLE